MNERISALMDGELDGRTAAEAIERLGAEPQAREAWRTYHLIGDAMRDTPQLSAGFGEKLARRLELEPTVLATRRLPEGGRPMRWPAALAAGAAGVSLVGYLALAPHPDAPMSPPATLAVAPAAAPGGAAGAAPGTRLTGGAPVKPTLIPLPSATPDYLLAHQAFSPRVSLQGMAPYVRTVSEQANEARR